MRQKATAAHPTTPNKLNRKSQANKTEQYEQQPPRTVAVSCTGTSGNNNLQQQKVNAWEEALGGN